MKVQLKVGPKAIVEAEGESVKKVFEQIARLAEVFVHASKCGACQSENVTPQVRENSGYTFYEITCLDCRARLTFGQTKEGHALFPQRKDKAGNWLDNNGWVKFERGSDNHRQAGVPGGKRPSGAVPDDDSIPY